MYTESWCERPGCLKNNDNNQFAPAELTLQFQKRISEQWPASSQQPAAGPHNFQMLPPPNGILCHNEWQQQADAICKVRGLTVAWNNHLSLCSPWKGGMLPLCSPRCTIALQRVPFRLKSEQVPKVGLLKSKEMIKSKPGWSLNLSYYKHWFLSNKGGGDTNRPFRFASTGLQSCSPSSSKWNRTSGATPSWR